MYTDGINPQTVGFWKDAKVADWRENGRWKLPRGFVRRWPELARKISRQQLYDRDDKVIRILNKSGTFTIDSAYQQLRHKERKVEWFPIVWNTKQVPRQQFIMWLMIRDSLKTRSLLVKRGMNIDPKCVLCDHSAETTQHLFFVYGEQSNMDGGSGKLWDKEITESVARGKYMDQEEMQGQECSK